MLKTTSKSGYIVQKGYCKCRRILNSNCCSRMTLKFVRLFNDAHVNTKSSKSWVSHNFTVVALKKVILFTKFMNVHQLQTKLKKSNERSYRIQIYSLLQQCLPLLQSYYFLIQFCFTCHFIVHVISSTQFINLCHMYLKSLILVSLSAIILSISTVCPARQNQ